MAKRNYSSTSDVRSLAAAMNATDTGVVGTDPNRYSTITLNTIVGSSNLPSVYPYTLVIDPDVSGKEEIVTVLSQASTYVYNVNRASDGTSAVAHASAAVVKHMVTARDMQEPQEHINASGVYTIKNDGSDVSVTTGTIVKPLHGLTTGDGNVVGTDASQTLTRKTLTNPTINTGTLTGTIANSGTISGGTITGGTITASSLTSPTINGATLTGTITNSGTITGGTITSGTINSATLDAASTIGGVSGTTLAANQASWTSWTPTWSGTGVSATGASSPSYRYSIVGKTVNFRISVVKGTSNFGTADLAFSTPTGYTPLATTIGDAVFNNGAQRYLGIAIISSAGTITPLANPDVAGTLNYGRSPTNTTVPFTWGTSDSIIITGTYEVA